MFTVYKITGPTGKSYIGYTGKTMAQRWQKHKDNARHRSTPLYLAMLKYGVHCFSIEVLETGIPDKESAWLTEILAIDLHITLAPGGYNVSHGGRHDALYVKTLDGRNSIASTWTPERRAALAKRNIAVSRTPEFRTSMAAVWTPERRAAQAIRRAERNRAPDRQNELAAIWTPERRAAQAELNRNRGKKQ